MQDTCNIHAGLITDTIAETTAKSDFDLSIDQLVGRKYAEKTLIFQ